MGEPEDLSGCSRTVFGVKILCGLISPINPQSFERRLGIFYFFTAEDAESAEKTFKVRSDEFDTDKKKI